MTVDRSVGSAFARRSRAELMESDGAETEVRPLRTHDYTSRCWGHDYVFRPIDNGQRGDLTGWGNGIRRGDFLLLQNGTGSTRYRVERITYYPDPPDMWEASVTFAPRTVQ